MKFTSQRKKKKYRKALHRLKIQWLTLRRSSNKGTPAFELGLKLFKLWNKKLRHYHGTKY